MNEFAETPMADDTPPIPSVPPARFNDVAKASRDRDLHADQTKDTVLFRDERTDPHTYDWCYLGLWRWSELNGGRRQCRPIVIRHGKRRSGVSAY